MAVATQCSHRAGREKPQKASSLRKSLQTLWLRAISLMVSKPMQTMAEWTSVMPDPLWEMP